MTYNLDHADQSVLDDLAKFGKLFEVAKITRYRAFRNEDDREIEIEIGDMGPKAGNLRYHVRLSC